MSDPVQPADARTDPELIAAINAGDARAFEALYLRYRDWAVALAYRFTGDRDTALDVMQDAFLYVLRQFPGFMLTAQFKTFLYPVVRHLSLAAVQKSQRFAGDDQALDELPATPAPPDAGGAEAARAGLEPVLSALPPGQREVLLLRFVDGLPLQEIAAALGVPLGTVKSRLHLALAALRQDPRAKTFFEP